jgi:stage V sporulation protein D (sporulation-specific penicillin-binding protein)
MQKNKTYNKKKLFIYITIILIFSVGLIGRLVYVMIFKSEYYTEQASDVQLRERSIKAARGEILDRNGVVIATNKTVCTISVIHSQVKDAEAVIQMLVNELGIDEAEVRKKVEKVSAREKIKSNVDKAIGDKIRAYDLDGVKVDEDYKRYYPYSDLASKVLGFTGADNQGIIGLEVEYEKYLKGTDGQILTLTDAKGIEIADAGEKRVEPVTGNSLNISLDVNIQMYAEQEAKKVLEAKQANYVSMIVMSPVTGEILAMVNVPEFDLNDPFTLNYDFDLTGLTADEQQNLLNKMWRNQCINDTYEPGSTFKIITTTAGLEEKVVSLDDTFVCGGYRIVEGRRIKCHKTIGHGTETFVEGILNSCNPVFIDVGLRLGVDNFYKYFDKLGLLTKTGVDLPGEATTIIHKKENVGQVELATMSFGQSFQITPIQLLAAASAVINGGTIITPHFGVSVQNTDGDIIDTFSYETQSGVISKETSETVKYLLERVVSEGTGKNAYLEGFRIGGKTATSEKLPRSAKKYISSFIGFAPANDPQVIAICIVDEPQGGYYGSTVAAPAVRDLFANILPYIGVQKQESTEEESTQGN